MDERQEQFAALAQPSVKAMGLSPPKVAARLFVAMTMEAALMELEAGLASPARVGRCGRS